MSTQTVEQFLFEQLERVAPGRYTLASVLQVFKPRLRFNCNHLKGGGRRHSLLSPGKDYNLSVFTFPTGVTEIKCLYNCGLKIRSDQKDMEWAFNEAYDLPTTNHPAKAEELFVTKGGKRVPHDPGPVPQYSDAYRQRIKESTELFWDSVNQMLATGRIQPGDPIFGGVFPHPDPIEAPDTKIERGIVKAFQQTKNAAANKAVQDTVPEVKSNTKIRKARKTQSRRKSGK